LTTENTENTEKNSKDELAKKTQEGSACQSRILPSVFQFPLFSISAFQLFLPPAPPSPAIGAKRSPLPEN
jgi:hypothetical protein